LKRTSSTSSTPKFFSSGLFLDIPNNEIHGDAHLDIPKSPTRGSRISAEQQMEMEAILLSKEYKEQVRNVQSISTELVADCQVLK
jgi:hypothetical protein